MSGKYGEYRLLEILMHIKLQNQNAVKYLYWSMLKNVI